MILKTILLLPLLNISYGVFGDDLDLFSSTSDLTKLYDKEVAVTKKLEDYLGQIEYQIEKLDWLLDNYYKDYNFTEDDAEEYVSNPINAYVLLKRTSIDWPRVRDAIFNETTDLAYEELQKELASFPGEDNIEGAANGMFLLQETYDLDPDQFGDGYIQIPYINSPNTPLKGTTHLYAKDMETIGKLAFNRGFYDRSYEWLSAAKRKALRDQPNETELIKSIEVTTKAVMRAHDTLLERKGEPRGRDWRTYVVPFNNDLAKKKKYKKALKANGGDRRYNHKPMLRQFLGPFQMWDQFNQLCRGIKMITPEDAKKLSCFYLHYHDPYLRLGPFKLDEQSHLPYVTVFRNIMYDNECDEFRKFAEPMLHRSGHLGKNGQRDQHSVKRTSKQTWLFDHIELDGYQRKNVNESTFKAARNVNTRIELATQLSAKAGIGGEPFQVANYGIGGVYNAHTDASGEGLEKDTEWTAYGDRIATFMAYLTDVEVGGGTSYTHAGILINAEKGSAAFWWNLSKNGASDPMTAHGGCPVLTGNKWITNKWIRWYPQMDKIPCTTNFNEFPRNTRLTN